MLEGAAGESNEACDSQGRARAGRVRVFSLIRSTVFVPSPRCLCPQNPRKYIITIRRSVRLPAVHSSHSSTMLLTQCACCAAPLPLLAKQCSRCKTRYCGPACQAQHWKEGGHDKLCKKIRKGGGAERCHADTKYKEAVATAVEMCAEDTKGQACYICTESIESRTKEGLVRMCSCGDRDGVASGTAGIVHVSCLVRQAQIACDDEMSNEDRETKWSRWDACRVCGQRFNGAVACALGWACWRTYLSRPLTDELRRVGLCALGVGLQKTRQY